ncbi:DNA-binding protein [Psychrobacter sp. ANT_H56B]|uniref:DNA-binding protein n=1 Tax=Psychrobacter sp. ANT_H56B TaxID=2597353 RepID=UPI00165DEF34|nr:DNA-binding protein [Psychrobacter sp. ANT_H56B]
MAITTQQIHATADQLQEQGIKPTLAEVRKALGGGSFTTISEAMKSWRQDHHEEEQLRQVDLPSGITERLHTLGADVWQTAIDMANDRLVKEREALEVIKAKGQAETDEAQEAVKTLEGEQSDLLEQLDEVMATAETEAIKANQATAERDNLKQTLSDTQHQLELERIKADTTQAQLIEAQAALHKQSTELSASVSTVAKLEATAESDKAEIARLKTELEAVKVELKTVTTERNEITTVTAEVKGELKAITAERDKLSGLYDQLTQTQANVEAEHRLLNKQYDELSTNYLSEQGRVTALQTELKKAQSELAVAQNKNNDSGAD